MDTPPAGTVTFLFADLEGSERLHRELGDRYPEVLGEYRRLLRLAVNNQEGREVNAGSGGCLFAFPRAGRALSAAVAASRAVHRRPWPADVSMRARMGLHTGERVGESRGHVPLDAQQAIRICDVGHGGQILLSSATRELVADDLPKDVSLRDLGAHRLRDLGGPQSLFQIVAAELPAEFRPLNSLDALPNNLPIQLTSFIGREHERSEVKRLLAATRLLTLIGAGGCGKTRLALHVAAESIEQYAGGVWVVDLARLGDPALLLQTVTTALGASEEPTRPLSETLRDYLRPKSLLLVLDNCEHLLPACAQLADALLRACPGLRILATSREALRIAGETTWRVPSLALPDPQRLPSLERLMEIDAIRLFAERAAAVLPAFTITPRNASAIACTCHQLDGIPLAIELAAARTNVLGIEQISSRLDDRFRLLIAGSRTAPPRQQTLLAAMEWSHDLLAERERVLLRRLSVFSGGWTLEAAEAVCSGESVEAADILDLLTQLVNKSLVVADMHGGPARYRLLETVRQYGRGKLSDAGEAETVRARHHDFFLRLAEEAEPELRGTGQAVWMNRLGADDDNLRGALEWSAQGTTDAGLRLAAALWRFWAVNGNFTEGRRWLRETLERSGGGSPVLRARALHGAGSLAATQNDYAEARALYEDSLALYRTLGDKRGTSTLIGAIGTGLRKQGDYAGARAYLEQSLAISRELEDRQGIATALAELGHDFWHEQQYAKARSLLEESLPVCREFGLGRTTTYVLWSLGLVAFDEGDTEKARALYAEGLTTARAYGETSFVIRLVESCASLAVPDGTPQRGAALLGAAQAAREALAFPIPPSHRDDYNRHAAAIRSALGDKTFARGWERGRGMTLEQAVDYALTPVEPTSPTAAGREQPGTSGQADVLTAREREIATLVARGLSNREIASRLVIAPRTAQTHVQHILTKLGMTSRAQIAVWAVEQGLHAPKPAS